MRDVTTVTIDELRWLLDVCLPVHGAARKTAAAHASVCLTWEKLGCGGPLTCRTMSAHTVATIRYVDGQMPLCEWPQRIG